MSTMEANAEAASLRERKKRATRAALRHAALSLVASRGLCAVTVDEIAAEANVSPRTFFNYFPSKEDAVSGIDLVEVANLVERLRERPFGETPFGALRAVMLEALSSIDADHRDLLERLRVTRSEPHLLAHHAACWAETERLLVAALAERRGSDTGRDRYAALVVATTLTASRVAMMSWCDGLGRVPLAEELAFHLDVLGAGLAEPERRMT